MRSKKNYFRYFNNLVSGKLPNYIFLNFFVGLLDGIGLTLFIPLIYLTTSSENQATDNKSSFITHVFEQLNLPLNIYTILGLMVFMFALKGFFSYIRSVYYTKILQLSARNIRFSLINGLKTLTYEGFTKIDSGTIQNNMTTEANRLLQASSLYMTIIQNIAMLLIYLFLAFIADWKFAILVAAGGSLSNFIYKYLNKLTTTQARKLSSLGRNFQSYLIQCLTNFKYLKATNYFEKYNERLKQEILDSEDTQYKIGKISAISDNLREPLIIIIISIVLVIQLNFLKGEMDTMMAALLLFYRSLSHLANFQGLWNKFLTNVPARESIDTILSEFKTTSEKNGSISNFKFSDIKINNLNFAYGEQYVLKDINIHIENKKSIALIGESGAGKTTLANIICGLIQTNNSNFIVGDYKLEDLDIQSYRNKVGYVTQEPVVFDDTLFNNISFFLPKTKENLDKFWKAIEMASLKDFVAKFPEKEDVQLGNNGILISGGQKQRISIARELYKDINLMILDEATSALDSETEKLIKDQIDSMHGKFTMVVIAHRLSTIKNVDVIYLMEDGRIIDFGSYDELYNKSLKFRNMVELQNVSS